MRLYGEIIPELSEGIIDRTGAQTMLYLTCTMKSSVDLAHYGVYCAKDWVSVDCGTMCIISLHKLTYVAVPFKLLFRVFCWYHWAQLHVAHNNVPICITLHWKVSFAYSI